MGGDDYALLYAARSEITPYRVFTFEWVFAFSALQLLCA
jgi:hypothetical protein